MAQDSGYTAEMKAATSAATSAATGGNPNVGPPVTHRPPTNSSPCALSSLAQGRATQRKLPDEDDLSAGLATRAYARTIRGSNCLSRSIVDELSMRPPLPALSEPVVSVLPVSPPVLPAVYVPCVPAFSVPGCLPPLQGKPPKKTRRTANVPNQSNTVVTWVNPLITTPTQQSIPNHNPKSNCKLSHPAQQHPT
jgi:hypothetical protein